MILLAEEESEDEYSSYIKIYNIFSNNPCDSSWCRQRSLCWIYGYDLPSSARKLQTFDSSEDPGIVSQTRVAVLAVALTGRRMVSEVLNICMATIEHNAFCGNLAIVFTGEFDLERDFIEGREERVVASIEEAFHA